MTHQMPPPGSTSESHARHRLTKDSDQRFIKSHIGCLPIHLIRFKCLQTLETTLSMCEEEKLWIHKNTQIRYLSLIHISQQLLNTTLANLLKEQLAPETEFWNPNKTLVTLMEKKYFENGLPNGLKQFLEDGKNLKDNFVSKW